MLSSYKGDTKVWVARASLVLKRGRRATVAVTLTCCSPEQRPWARQGDARRGCPRCAHSHLRHLLGFRGQPAVAPQGHWARVEQGRMRDSVPAPVTPSSSSCTTCFCPPNRYDLLSVSRLLFIFLMIGHIARFLYFFQTGVHCIFNEPPEGKKTRYLMWGQRTIFI